MLFSFIVLIIALFITGIGVSVYILALPIIMIVEFMFVMGLSLIVSCINVYFRDIEQIVGIFTLAWQFLSPVMYDVSMVPEQVKSLFYLNPMTNIIIAYRNILYDKLMPDLSTLLFAVGLSAVFLIAGYCLFQRLQRGFAEEL
jgi:ABC-2 type transport system permease protein